jgi:uncharacterized peroxidase-related enzyme
MAHIDVIDYERSEGRLREIYDDLITRRGKLAEVHMIQSLRPESIVKHIDLYLEIMFSKSELSRAEREMVAVIVSANNNCEYCQIHHAEALNNYWKDDEKVMQLRRDYTSLDLSDKHLSLCNYARILTLDPGKANEEDLTAPMKAVGLSDSAILDATLVIAYFNFVNRIVQGLSVGIEEDQGAGYKY